MQELIIGSHVSFKSSDQLVGSVKEAISYGANTFMFYTGAPQNTNRAKIDDGLTMEAYKLMKEHNIELENVIVHAPYIINLANTDKLDSYNFAIDFLRQEITRCESLGMTKLVLHPGSSVKLPKEVGIKNIINALNKVLTKEQKVIILLETMAGKGSEIGSSFEEIKEIIDGVTLNNKLGVCLDTCHISDAGYDISNFDDVLDEFNRIIGLDKLMCIHVNDSKNPMGAHKDRHENFGFGLLGFNNLINVVYNKRLENIPKILETPYIDGDSKRMFPPYKFEIEMIRNKKFNPDLLEEIRAYYK